MGLSIRGAIQTALYGIRAVLQARRLIRNLSGYLRMADHENTSWEKSSTTQTEDLDLRDDQEMDAKNPFNVRFYSTYCMEQTEQS